MPSPKGGLEDVVAGTSEICFIDGDEGRLLYRGYNIHDLVEHATFEEVVYLLWYGSLPTRQQLDSFVAELKGYRSLPEPILQLIKSFPKAATPMEVLRTAISALSAYDPDDNDMSREANLRKAARLTAQTATVVAAIGRTREGKEPVAPRNDLNHATNFLYMLFGSEPSELFAKAMDTALILHADHELNASTFAARVTAATLSDIYSSVVSAIGALKGPLHGGANEQVMNMLLQIGSKDKAEAYIKEKLDAKEKIMGFGHRVYHTEDPRATHLRRMSERIGQEVGQPQWFEISQLVEKTVHQLKGLYPNVDFYSASTYYTMGIPTELFTPVFAVSRISGWTAHILEQYSNNRLIRPRAEYVGKTRETYVPIEKRG